MVVTLLVLELNLPHLGERTSAREHLRGLLELAPALLGWLIRSVTASRSWLNHHPVLDRARSGDCAPVS